QAEDGIRDLYVTGVQTCALPISIASGCAPRPVSSGAGRADRRAPITREIAASICHAGKPAIDASPGAPAPCPATTRRTATSPVEIGRASGRGRIYNEVVLG